jgi:succinyl-CoA synthetase beta subunit
VRLYEQEAKRVFAEEGLEVPTTVGVVRSVEELEALEVEYPVMVKALVLSGGRGKAGGVAKVGSAEEAKEAVERILGLTIGGYAVEAVLLEKAVEEQGACYLGVTLDPATYHVVVLASAKGGVDIEAVAKEEPDAVLPIEIPRNDPELPGAVRREIGEFLFERLEDGTDSASLGEAAAQLYAVFQKYDCKVAEINPLLVQPSGDVVAADAKVVIDDNALYRQRRLFRLLGLAEARHDSAELTSDERRARDAGFPFVDLLPQDTEPDPEKLYVGLVPGGAGYGIFSIDEVAGIGERFFGGRAVPVNFMDSGGGPPLPRVAEMFHLLMDKEIVDLIVTSRFGGISSCDVFIRGLIQCLRDRHARGDRIVPVRGRMVGTDLPSARANLERAQIETPEPLADLDIVVGNRHIMADVIKNALTFGLERKRLSA